MATDVVHTACTLDCPDTCSLAVTVTDGRITAIDASPDNPFTDGWICAKVKRHGRRVHSPARVLTPLVRSGPKGEAAFRPATWDEALELVAAKVRAAVGEVGPDGVVAFTYNSSAATIEQQSATEALFAALGATRAEHTICAHTTGLAWESVLGSMSSADPCDVVHSDLVVIWGANPTISNTHFPPLVQQAVARGARTVVIDPRRTAMADRADLHLAVRPGTDVVLALALAAHWDRTGRIDRAFVARHATGADELLAAAARWSLDDAAGVCGVAADDIRVLAGWWGETPATMVRIGWGQERNANGGAACRAILALPVLAGGFGVPGSGIVGATRPGAVRARRRWPELEARPRRTVAMHQVGRWLAPEAGDPCRVLFVQGSNPLVMCPDQQAVRRAFAREDVFTVVHDQVLTDTARWADVVLPATTSFEIDDVAQGYGTLVVQPVRRVIDPVGESRSNDQTGLALARALGFDWALPGTDATIADPGPRRADVPSRQFVDTFPPNGAACLADPVHGAPQYVPVPRDAEAFPLVLISPATAKTINSIFGEFQSPGAGVVLSPADAAARGLAPGDTVRVASATGEIRVPLDVSDSVRPGVAVMSKGVWLDRYADGWGVNALTPSTGDALGGGACFNDTFVEVRRA